MVSKKGNEEMEHLNYVSYEELIQINSNEIQDSKISVLINSLVEIPKWTINFDALIYLRRLNKYNSTIAKQILPNIESSINKLSNSIRSGIIVECLMFLCELFHHYTIEKDNDIFTITPFVAISLHCTFHSKAFIRDHAKKALMEYLINNQTFINFSFCSELLIQMRNDKQIISDTAYEVSEKLNQKITSFDTISSTQWKLFFEYIDLLYGKKREPFVKKAIKILKEKQDKLSIQKMNIILKESGLEQNIETYENWIKLREKKNTPHISINDYKKQMKKNKEVESEDNL